jgi:hypothetical protein
MAEESAFEKQRRKRNIALALGLCALAVLFFVITLLKFAGHG